MNPLIEVIENEALAADVSAVFEYDELAAQSYAYEEDAAENLYAPLF